MANDSGILGRRTGDRFTLTRLPPADDLASVLDWFWLVRWDLRGKPPFSQETLPFPCVNVVIGTHRPGIHGPVTTRSVAHLHDRGWVIGAKFRPAGFRAICAMRPVDLVDRTVSIADAFGSQGRALDQAVFAARDDRARVDLFERFVRDRRPVLSSDGHQVNAIVEMARADPSIQRVADLATRAGRPVRTIERLFRAHVGMPPKSVLRRFRVQEAAVRLAAGAHVDCTALAYDLGYFDQAHFIRDFKLQVGKTPAHYAKMCRPD